MDVRDVIRAVLDILDKHDNTGSSEPTEEPQVMRVTGDDEPSRFRQIFALLDKGEQLPLANTPNEKVAPVDSVTTLAGGGVNGPKHPADIRVKDPRGFE